jgi:hypothetical protein
MDTELQMYDLLVECEWLWILLAAVLALGVGRMIAR